MHLNFTSLYNFISSPVFSGFKTALSQHYFTLRPFSHQTVLLYEQLIYWNSIGTSLCSAVFTAASKMADLIKMYINDHIILSVSMYESASLLIFFFFKLESVYI